MVQHAALQQRRPPVAESMSPRRHAFTDLADSIDERFHTGEHHHFLAASSSAAAAAAAALPAAAKHRLALSAAAKHGPPVRAITELFERHHTLRAVILASADDQPLVGLGLALMVIGTIASALGMLSLKRAHGPAFASIPWYRNSWFWLGIVLFVFTAAGLDIIVFGITPLSLIAPFAGLTIVVSFVFATIGVCGVREIPTKTSLVAVVLITAGVTICSIFGPHDGGTLEPSELTRLFNRAPALFSFCVSGGPLFLVFSLASTFKADEVRETLRSWSGALTLAVVAAIYGACTQLQFKAVAAAVMEIMQHVFDNGRNRSMYASTGEFFLQICTLISSAVAQIGFLNYAISVAPVAYSVPAYQAGLLITTLVLSGWVLGEFQTLSFFESCIFWGGAGVVAGGMLLNAWGLVRHAEVFNKKEGGEMVGSSKPGQTVYADEPPSKPFVTANTDEESVREVAGEAASAKFG